MSLSVSLNLPLRVRPPFLSLFLVISYFLVGIQAYLAVELLDIPEFDIMKSALVQCIEFLCEMKQQQRRVLVHWYDCYFLRQVSNDRPRSFGQQCRRVSLSGSGDRVSDACRGVFLSVLLRSLSHLHSCSRVFLTRKPSHVFALCGLVRSQTLASWPSSGGRGPDQVWFASVAARFGFWPKEHQNAHNTTLVWDGIRCCADSRRRCAVVHASLPGTATGTNFVAIVSGLIWESLAPVA